MSHDAVSIPVWMHYALRNLAKDSQATSATRGSKVNCQAGEDWGIRGSRSARGSGIGPGTWTRLFTEAWQGRGKAEVDRQTGEATSQLDPNEECVVNP